jgi:hypothetical protein
VQIVLSGVLATQFDLTTTGSGNVSAIHISAAQTGADPEIAVDGVDTNINLVIAPKGTGHLVLGGSAAVQIPGAATGTPVASLCLDAGGNVIKKTTSGACL